MPYRSPGADDPSISGFLNEIDGAQSRIDSAIEQAKSLPDSDLSKSDKIKRYNALKREVSQTADRLTRQASEWSAEGIPRLYNQGFMVAGLELDSGFSFSLLHQEAVDTLVSDAYDDVATGLRQVATDFNGKLDTMRSWEELSPASKAVIQTQGKSSVSQQLLTGLTDPKRTAAELRDKLWENGVEIVDRSNRRWSMDTYSRMLVRTKSAAAYNTGSLNKFAEEGVVRVEVFDGVLDDPECAEANGQIWTVKYAQQNILSHPNCRRAFGPLPTLGTVNRFTTKDLPATVQELELWEQFLKATTVWNKYKQWSMNPGVIDIQDLMIQNSPVTRRFRQIELDLFGNNRRSTYVLQQVNRTAENIIDPLLVKANILDEAQLPEHVRKDWKAIKRGILMSRTEVAESFARPEIREFIESSARRALSEVHGSWINKLESNEFTQLVKQWKLRGGRADLRAWLTSNPTIASTRSLERTLFGSTRRSDQFISKAEWLVNSTVNPLAKRLGVLAEVPVDTAGAWDEAFEFLYKVFDDGRSYGSWEEILAAYRPQMAESVFRALDDTITSRPYLNSIRRWKLSGGVVNVHDEVVRRFTTFDSLIKFEQRFLGTTDRTEKLRRQLIRLAEDVIDPVAQRFGILDTVPERVMRDWDRVLDLIVKPVDVNGAARTLMGSVAMYTEEVAREAFDLATQRTVQQIKRSWLYDTATRSYQMVRDWGLDYDAIVVEGRVSQDFLTRIPVLQIIKDLEQDFLGTTRFHDQIVRTIADQSSKIFSRVEGDIGVADLKALAGDLLRQKYLESELLERWDKFAQMINKLLGDAIAPEKLEVVFGEQDIVPQVMGWLFAYPESIRADFYTVGAAREFFDSQNLDDFMRQVTEFLDVPDALASIPTNLHRSLHQGLVDVFRLYGDNADEAVLVELTLRMPHPTRPSYTFLDYLGELGYERSELGVVLSRIADSLEETLEFNLSRPNGVPGLRPGPFGGPETLLDDIDIRNVIRDTDWLGLLEDGYGRGTGLNLDVEDLTKLLKLEMALVGGKTVQGSGSVIRVMLDAWDQTMKDGIEWVARKPRIAQDEIGPTLKRIFGDANVKPHVDNGTNGTIWLVTVGEDTFGVKYYDGHFMHPLDVVIGESISEAIEERLGLPHYVNRFLPGGASDDRDVIQIMSWIPDVDSAGDFPAVDDMWFRRQALMDFISGERDGHGYNYSVRSSPDSRVMGVLYSIDKETTFSRPAIVHSRTNKPKLASGSMPRWRFKDALTNWMSDDGYPIGSWADGRPANYVSLDRDQLKLMKGMMTDGQRTGLDLTLNSAAKTGNSGYIHTNLGPVFYQGDELRFYPGQWLPNSGVIGRTPWHDPLDYPIVYLTDSESQLIKSLIDTDYEDIIGEVLDRFSDIPDGYFDSDLGSVTDLEGWIRAKLEETSRQIQEFSEEGLFVVGDNRVFDDFGFGEGYGARVELGKPVELFDDDGERTAGLVIHMFTNDEDERIVVIADGFLDPAQPAGGPITVTYVNEFDVSGPSFIDEVVSAEVLSAAPERSPYSVPIADLPYHKQTAEQRLVRTPIIDNNGAFQGFSESTMKVDVFKVEGKALPNDRVIYAQELVDGFNEILTEELSRIPPEYRPRSVEVTSNRLNVEGFGWAAGRYIPETRTLQVSMLELFDVVTSDLPLGVVDFDDLNVEGLRRIVRHELGHSVSFNVRERMRQELTRAVLIDMIEDPSLPAQVTWRQLDDIILDRQLLPADVQLRLISGEEKRRPLALLIEKEVDETMEKLDEARKIEIGEWLYENITNPDVQEWAAYPTRVRFPAVGERELWRNVDYVEELIAEAWTASGVRMPPPGMDERLYWGLFVDERHLALVNGDVQLSRALDPTGQTGIQLAFDLDIESSGNRFLLPYEVDEYYSPSRLLDKVFEVPAEEGGGGFTLDVVTGEQPGKGWAVALREREKPVEAEVLAELTAEEVGDLLDDFAEANKDLLDQDGWYLGVWWDEKKTGNLYLDVSRVFDDDVEAAAFGIDQDQLAMFNLETHFEYRLERFDQLDQYLVDRGHIPALAGVQSIGDVKRPVILRKDGPAEKEIKRILRKLSSSKELTPEEAEFLGALREVSPSGQADHAAMSLRDLPDDTAQKILGKFKDDYFYAAEGYVTKRGGKKKLVVTKVLDPIDASLDAVVSRYERVLVQAQALFESDEVIITNDWDFPGGRKLPKPLVLTGEEFRDRLRFYEQWNAGYRGVVEELVSEGLDMELPRVVAAAAAMSPGLLAQSNYVGAIQMARMTARNDKLTPKLAAAVRDYLREAIASAEKFGNLAKIAEYRDVIKRVQSGVRYNKLPDIAAVFATRAVISADKNHPLNLVSYLGWDHLIKARRILLDRNRPLLEVIDSNLTGSKVRSFFNNILDPEDVLGYRDLTIDFQMGEAGLGVRGADRDMETWSSPSLYGVKLGFRAVLAEAVNILWDRGWGPKVGAASIAELQEVVWGTWKHIKGEDLWDQIPQLVLKSKL